MKRRNRQRNAKNIAKKAASALKMAVGITLATALSSLVLGLLLARMIVKPLRDMVVLAKEMAAVLLRSRAIDVSSRDEVGQLSQAFNEMANNLRQLVQQVAKSSQQVATASGGLTEG